MAGEGHERGLLLLAPGEFFGELALIQGEGRLATAKSEGQTELLTLTRKDFQALLDLDPRTGSRLLMAITKLLAMRIRAYGDRFRNLLTA
jgi:CRP-like cAMP-binding protein